MKVVYHLILIINFLFIGSLQYGKYSIVLLVPLVVLAIIVTKKGSIKIPPYLYGCFAIYLFFLILGLINGHQSPVIDIKFQIFALLFYVFLLNKGKYRILDFLFLLNIVVFAIYVLLYLGVLSNYWHAAVVGYKGRVYGPSVIPIILICFYYLFHGMKLDKKLGFAFIIALPSLVLTTILMNIVILGVLFFLILVDIRKIFNPKMILGVLGTIVIAGAFFSSSFAPELIKEKVPYVLKPLEYESLKIRVDDLKKALRAEKFGLKEKIFGEGFGASTRIFRENEKAQSWSRFYTFQEIDNGYYYLYHRGGFILLALFIIVHLYLMSRIRFLKAKIGFVVIVGFTCLLSIHYFNNLYYLIIPFLVLEGSLDLQKSTILTGETS